MEGTEVPCAEGDGQVMVYRMITQTHSGDWDSDGAVYTTDRAFRWHAVSTCSDGLSLLGTDMARGLSPAMKAKIAPTLAEIRSQLPNTNFADLPVHIRHAHAARMYEALGQPEKAIQCWLTAAWLARDDAVNGVAGIQGPVAARRALAQGDAELLKALSVENRKILTFNMLIIAHRGGYVAKRKELLTAMKALPLTPAEATRVQTFEEAVNWETRYLEASVKRLKTATSRPYALAEALRRLGRVADAQPHYKRVVNAAEDSTQRQVASYFLAEARGESPWLDAKYQRIGLGELNP